MNKRHEGNACNRSMDAVKGARRAFILPLTASCEGFPCTPMLFGEERLKGVNLKRNDAKCGLNALKTFPLTTQQRITALDIPSVSACKQTAAKVLCGKNGNV